MIKTKFTLFKNTPFVDMQNTIHFRNNQERDSYFFDKGFFQKLEHDTQSKDGYNFIRSKSTIDVSIDYFSCRQCNYLSFFESEGQWTIEGTQRVYAHILEVEYINDNTTRIHFLIDPIMTWCQGNVIENFDNINVLRQHLPKNEYNSYLPILKSNEDILSLNSKAYFRTEVKAFDKFYILFQCVCDLEADFGSDSDPKMPTSSGGTFDKVTSPVNLYMCSKGEFLLLMDGLKDYPWIAQNITKVIYVPDILIDENDFKNVTTSTKSNIKKAKDNGLSTRQNFSYFNSLNKNESELLSLYGIKEDEKHLLRSNYFTCEVYGYNGDVINVDLGQLPDKGLNFLAKIIVGYENQISIYIDRYKSRNSNTGNVIEGGSFLNDSINFTQFDEMPILIDNYKLSLAKGANRRELAESKLITNRVKNILDPNADLKDRLMDTINVVGNFTSLSNVMGRFTDEYEFYRTQKAEFADMSLNQNTVTNMTNGNAFNVKNDIFGITVKYSKPVKKDIDKISYYYKKFGFETEGYANRVSNINSMDIMNYVQFKGTPKIENIDPYLLDILKARFEIGVFLWHYDNRKNPMDRNLILNERVE